MTILKGFVIPQRFEKSEKLGFYGKGGLTNGSITAFAEVVLLKSHTGKSKIFFRYLRYGGAEFIFTFP